MNKKLDEFPQDVLEKVYSYLMPNIKSLGRVNRFFNKSTKDYIVNIATKISDNLKKTIGYHSSLNKNYYDKVFLTITNILAYKRIDVYQSAVHELTIKVEGYISILNTVLQKLQTDNENKTLISQKKYFLSNDPEEILLLLAKFKFRQGVNAASFDSEHIKYFFGNQNDVLQASWYIKLAFLLNKHSMQDSFDHLKESQLNNKIVIDANYLAIHHSLVLRGRALSGIATDDPPKYFVDLLAMRKYFVGDQILNENFPTIESFLQLCFTKMKCSDLDRKNILERLSEHENRNNFLNNLLMIARSDNYFLIEILMKKDLLFVEFPAEALCIFNHPLSVWILNSFEIDFIKDNYKSLRFFTSPKWEKYKKQITEKIDVLNNANWNDSFSLRASEDMYALMEAKFFDFEAFVKTKSSISYYLSMFNQNSLGKLLSVPNVLKTLDKFLVAYKKKFGNLPSIPALKKLAVLDEIGLQKVEAFLQKMISIKMKAKVKLIFSDYLDQIINLVVNKNKATQLDRVVSYILFDKCKPQQISMIIKCINQEWPYLFSNEEIANVHINVLEKLSEKTPEAQKNIISILKAQYGKSENQFKITTKSIDLIASSISESPEENEEKYNSLLKHYNETLAEITQMEKVVKSLKREYNQLKKETSDQQEEQIKHQQKRGRFQ